MIDWTAKEVELYCRYFCARPKYLRLFILSVNLYTCVLIISFISNKPHLIREAHQSIFVSMPLVSSSLLIHSDFIF